jgi:hypothetical protein
MKGEEYYGIQFDCQLFVVTPSGEHPFQHETSLTIGKDQNEQLVHVNGLDQHPGQR